LGFSKLPFIDRALLNEDENQGDIEKHPKNVFPFIAFRLEPFANCLPFHWLVWGFLILVEVSLSSISLIFAGIAAEQFGKPRLALESVALAVIFFMAALITLEHFYAVCPAC
jgi:hypothetical protein